MVFIQEITYLKYSIRDGVYVTNLPEYRTIGTHQIPLCVKGDSLTHLAWELNTFRMKLKSSYVIKISQQIFAEYKNMIQ